MRTIHISIFLPGDRVGGLGEWGGPGTKSTNIYMSEGAPAVEVMMNMKRLGPFVNTLIDPGGETAMQHIGFSL